MTFWEQVRAHGYEGAESAASFKRWMQSTGTSVQGNGWGFTPDSSVEAIQASIDAYDGGRRRLLGHKSAGSIVNKSVTANGRKAVHVAADAGEEIVVHEGEDEGGEPDEPKGLSKSQRATQRIMREENARNGYTVSVTPELERWYDRQAKSGRTVFGSGAKANQFASWMRANIYGSRNYEHKALDNRVMTKAHATNVNSAGGSTVPDDFHSDIVTLFEEYGVAYQLANVVPMDSDYKLRPRLVSGPTTYWRGENATLTASDATTDSLGLTANKLTVYSECSNEILADSGISFADMLAREMARQVMKKVDESYLSGDGSSTYGGFTGVRTRLQNIDGGGSDSYGVTFAGGTAWTNWTLAGFTSMLGLLPAYAAKNAKWVVSQRFWAQVMLDRMLDAGGNAAADIAAGGPLRFLGKPVVISQVMPDTADSGGNIDVLLGDFGLGTMLGEVHGGLRIDSSPDVGFDKDQMAFRAILRVGINCHDLGSTTEAGPIVGGETAAS